MQECNNDKVEKFDWIWAEVFDATSGSADAEKSVRPVGIHHGKVP
jgi:hypothetical protein